MCQFNSDITVIQDFIDNQVPKSYQKTILSAMNSIEKTTGKGIWYCDVDEAIKGVEETGIWQPDTIRAVIRYTRKYAEYGYALGRCDKFKNGFCCITAEDINLEKQVRDAFIVHPAELFHIIAHTYDFEHKGFIDGVGIEYVIPGLVFEWSKIESVADVLESEVDVERHQVRGRQIPEELWPLVEQYKNNEYTLKGRGSAKDTVVTKNKGDTFLRQNGFTSSESKISGHTYKCIVSTTFHMKKLRSRNIRLASAFYDICHDEDYPYIDEDVLSEIISKNSKQRSATKITDFTQVIEVYSKLSENYCK